MFQKLVLALAALQLSWQSASCQNDTQNALNSTGIAPCDALIEAGLGSKVFSPTTEQYETSINGYWAPNFQLRPWCIMQPSNTRDVSTALQALSRIDDDSAAGGLAIRAGGHNSAAGANSIVNGVTMDLSMMNLTTYDASTTLASIQPGPKWKDVYAALSPYNVTVAGGRDGGVGAGLLLGGGISYYAASTGFSGDSVINFEVVLANGTIVNANQTHNSDLWKALKGGMNNFGIITRYDATTVPGDMLSYSERTISSDHSKDFVNALVDFTSNNNNATDDAIVGFFSYVQDIQEVIITLIEVNTRGLQNSTAFQQFNSIPANVSLDKVWTLAEAANSSQLAGGQRSTSSALTFKNDARVIHQAVQLHDALVASLSKSIGPGNFTTVLFMEPIPASVQRTSAAKGGNVFGLPKGEDLIIMDVGAFVTTNDADFAILHFELLGFTAQMKEYAQSIGQDIEFVYPDYADASQDVMGSYGSENVQFLRTVAQKYDPTGFFQERVSGGFKLW